MGRALEPDIVRSETPASASGRQ